MFENIYFVYHLDRNWNKQSPELWQGCKWLENVLLKIPQLNQDNLSDMIIENNKIEVRYHREMSLCNFRFGAAYQQFSIGSTNIYSTCTSGNNEKTCRKNAPLTGRPTFIITMWKNYTRYYLIIITQVHYNYQYVFQVRERNRPILIHSVLVITCLGGWAGINFPSAVF